MHVAGDVCEDLEIAPGQEVSVAFQTAVALHTSVIELLLRVCSQY